MNNGKDIVVKRNKDNKITGYSFKSINYADLLADSELLEIIATNEQDKQYNIRYGKKGDTFVNAENKAKTVNSDFFYVGYDTRTEYANADALLAVE